MKKILATLFVSALVSTALFRSSADAKQSSQGTTMQDSKPWNEESQIVFKPIGVIISGFKEQAGTPIQPVYAQGSRGKVVVFGAYKKALRDLNGFSRAWLIYYFDRAKPWTPTVVPYKGKQERGLFATRAPSRPNAIGISAVKILSVKDNEIEVDELDILDGTPLLDIKPYVSEFDSYPTENSGWLNAKEVDKKSADDRFKK